MFAVFMIMLFIQQVNNKLIFAGMVLFATVLPDLDSGFSSWGRHLIFRPLQFFVKHRGAIHSFTTAVIVSLVIAYFWPIGSFGFFIGFSVHLICDSFTIEGIQPFWPLRSKSTGFISTGGRIEETLFFALIFVDIILFFAVFVFG